MTDGTWRNTLGSTLSDLLQCLENELTPPPLSKGPGGLFGLAGPLAPPPSQPQGLLGGIFGTHPIPTMAQAAPVLARVRRKVFFSFHYDDIHRTVLVRNAWRFRKGWQPAHYNFYDKSLWEKTRTEDPETLKRMIRKGMADSSVTCVLAGAETYLRPYVRFEIAHSLLLKRGLFTVHIHNVRHRGYGTPGPDPLAYMGLELQADGRGRVCELVSGEWRHFDLMRMHVPWPRWMAKPEVGFLYPLNVGTSAYDHHHDQGYENLPFWAQVAAQAAGRR